MKDLCEREIKSLFGNKSQRLFQAEITLDLKEWSPYVTCSVKGIKSLFAEELLVVWG